eukprot:4702789-Heterocapsa_arctica.AAC.1
MRDQPIRSEWEKDVGRTEGARAGSPGRPGAVGGNGGGSGQETHGQAAAGRQDRKGGGSQDGHAR